MTFAPIALFVYNRIRHLRKTVEALIKNEIAEKSDLFIFSDGPRTDADAGKVAEVRDYLKTIQGFKSVTISTRARNLGLSHSIISGVTEVVDEYGRIIVLEDDISASPYFLKYMNGALDLYRDCEDVISIHGYVYPVRAELPETFFLRGADCWGWATWKRGWESFEPDGRKLLTELKGKKLEKQFDVNGSYPFTKMLKDQVAGKNDSWAIRWHASAFLRNRLTLYPGVSLVRNIGTDESGRHCLRTHVFDAGTAVEPVHLRKIPIEESHSALKVLEDYFNSIKPTFLQRMVRCCTRMIE
jgi:hypothetical protein